jgi:hypothetical protein
VFFARDAWQAAYIVARKALPQEPLPVNAVIRIAASFGGFLGRKGDGEPGTKALWTGLQRVMDSATGIRAYRSGDESCG